jgi:CheY-like chemotaxis protein
MAKNNYSYCDRDTPSILCIDDDPGICENIELRLRQYDVDVLRAYHGTHGLSLAITGRPDLIITDMRMPQGGGAYIVESLRRNPDTKDIPIIVLTGQRNHAFEAMANQHSADVVLIKPVQFKVLAAAIGKFVPLRIRKKSDATVEL